MEEAWLRSQLESGRSIESIAREVGRDPSTVAYWVNKHGLVSVFAARHSARGPITREELVELIESGMTISTMAATLGRSGTSVRHWLRRHGLQTQRARGVAAASPGDLVLRRCRRHGFALFVVTKGGRHRCKRCRTAAVTARRRRVKQILVEEAGGCCARCGSDRFAGALQFHHLDPGEKSFTLSERGLARSIAKARTEVAKCVLLCANCHAEVEGGIATIARSGPADNLAVGE